MGVGLGTCTHSTFRGKEMTNTHTKEQRKAWDKVTGPGLYTVEGEQAYQYVCDRIKWLVIDKSDPHTVLLIGEDKHKEAFLKQMIERGVIDDIIAAPEFKMYPDYQPDPADDDNIVPRSLWSENDTDDFCNFILNADPKVNGYYKVAAVVLLGEQDQLKHVDKLLKIPKWRGSTLEKHIELPVYNVSSDEVEHSNFSKANNNTPSGVKQTLQLTRGDEIEEKSVEWLVHEFYPKNEVTICTGQMDTLKSTTNIDIAAAGSGFRPWFMGDQLNEHGVQVDRHPFITLYAASEDDPARTILPRYKAAGGNPDCIYFLKQVVKEKKTDDGLVEWESSFTLDEHMELLRENIRDLNNTRGWPVGLLVLDPLITVFGNKNYNSPQDTNDLMVKLRRLCSEEQITVVGITHYNKTQGLVAKDKTSGSKRIVESARMAWGFDRADGDSETTIISPIKKNLLAKAKSYKITTVDHDGVGVIKFLGYTEVTADEQIEAREDKGRGQRKELKAAILDALKDGPKSAGQVCNELQDMGSVSSIGRAARSLEEEGKLTKSGNNRKNLVWQLATEAEQPTFDEVTNGSV
jgi:hypothetical protein